MSASKSSNLLSDQVKAQIDQQLAKFPEDKKRSVVLMALRFVQKEQGWLSEAAMDAVADYLGLPPVQVYEVATFYAQYELKPVGKFKIKVCDSISCHLRGSHKIIEQFKERLGIEVGETTPDGLFTLQEGECFAACAGAPMCQVNDDAYIENLDADGVDALLKDCRTQSEQE